MSKLFGEHFHFFLCVSSFVKLNPIGPAYFKCLRKVRFPKQLDNEIFFLNVVGNPNTFNLKDHQVLNLVCPSIKD